MGRRSHWVGWVLLFLTVGLVAALPAAGGRDRAQHARPPLVVVVKYGESLWTIAEAYREPSLDVRDVVLLIGAANGVDPGKLRPGTKLVVPPSCLPATSLKE